MKNVILFGMLLAMLFLIPTVNPQISLAAKEDLVQMIENTDNCLVDCHTDYLVCNPELDVFTPSKSSDFNVSFIMPLGENLLDSGVKIWEQEIYYVELPIEKLVPVETPNGTVYVKEIVGYDRQERTRWDWVPFNPFTFTFDPGACHEVRVWGKRGAKTGFSSIDNVLSFAGKEFREWADWNTSAQSCTTIKFNNPNRFNTMYNNSPPIKINMTSLVFQNASRGIHIVNDQCKVAAATEIEYYLIENGTDWAYVEVMSPNVTAMSYAYYSVYHDWAAGTEYTPEWADTFTVHEVGITVTTDYLNVTMLGGTLGVDRPGYVDDLNHLNGLNPAEEITLRGFFEYTSSGIDVAGAGGSLVNGTFFTRTPFYIEVNFTTTGHGNITYTFYDHLAFFKWQTFDSNATRSEFIFITGATLHFNWSQNMLNNTGGVMDYNTTQPGLLAFRKPGDKDTSMVLFNVTEWNQGQADDAMGSGFHLQGAGNYYLGGLGSGTVAYRGWNNATFWYGYGKNNTELFVNETYWAFINNPLTYEYYAGANNYSFQNETYNSPVLEDSNQEFTLTLWVNTSIVSSVNASLIWNYTEYHYDTLDTLGSYRTFHRNVTMPLINATDATIPFYWNYSIFYTVGSYDNETTTTHNQIIATYYQSFNITLYTENDWDALFNISIPEMVELFLYCEGGGEYIYNLTNANIEVQAFCRVDSIMAKVTYPTDSYTRQILAPEEITANVSLYMVDAYNYTVLQIPFYMDDYNYYDSRLVVYKSTVSENYIISEGYFDVEHKFVTYLIKDSKYLLRIRRDSEIRDISFFYPVSATAQHLAITAIELRPSISLISSNLLMSAEVDNTTEVLRIQYRDLTNQTNSVRIRVYEGVNQTAFFDSTYTGTNLITVTINDINVSRRYSILFTVNHQVYGNSPIDFVVGAGLFGGLFNLGVPTWMYSVFGFIIMLFVSFVTVPRNRLAGIVFLAMVLGIMIYVQWFEFAVATTVLIIVFVALSVVYEFKKGGMR